MMLSATGLVAFDAKHVPSGTYWPWQLPHEKIITHRLQLPGFNWWIFLVVRSHGRQCVYSSAQPGTSTPVVTLIHRSSGFELEAQRKDIHAVYRMIKNRWPTGESRSPCIVASARWLIPLIRGPRTVGPIQQTTYLSRYHQSFSCENFDHYKDGCRRWVKLGRQCTRSGFTHGKKISRYGDSF